MINKNTNRPDCTHHVVRDVRCLHSSNVRETSSAIHQSTQNITFAELVSEEVDKLCTLDCCAITSDSATVASVLLKKFALFHQALIVCLLQDRPGQLLATWPFVSVNCKKIMWDCKKLMWDCKQTYLDLARFVASIAWRKKGCPILLCAISSAKNALPHASSTSSSSNSLPCFKDNLLCLAGDACRFANVNSRARLRISSFRFFTSAFLAIISLNCFCTFSGARVHTCAITPLRNDTSPERCMRALWLGKILPPMRRLQCEQRQKYLGVPFSLCSVMRPYSPPK